jgi:transcriptional regulator with GAF, ATPase, and Fis domain/Tfp pilus assembly protein PilF
MSSRVTAAEVEALHPSWERELQGLVREYEEARSSGQGRLAFVRGPSGVGKSSLLGALRRRLAANDVRVFEGGTRDHQRGTYGLFREMVPSLLAHLVEAGVPSRVISELQRRTAPLRGGVHAGGEDPQLELADAVAELFSLAGRSSPAFLLNDLESADRASLELLRYLLASARAPGAQSGGLYVLAYRDDASLPEPLVDITGKLTGYTVALSGLDLDGIRAYFARHEVAERLLDLTGGLPAVLEQVISSAPDSHPHDLFLRRVQKLPTSEQDALLALAVLSEPASSDEVASILVQLRGQAPLDLLTRLQRLSSARLLSARTQHQLELFSFAREADREALLAHAPEADVRSLHRAWGHELLHKGAEPERIARHLLAADPEGEGLDAAERAAQALANRLAIDDAIEMYLKVLAHAPTASRGELHRKLAELYRAVADYPASLRHVGLWRRSLPADEKRRARAEAARVLVSMGRLVTAERLLRSVLGALSEIGEPARIDESDAASSRAYTELAEVLFLRGEYARALSWCERGLASLSSSTELTLALRNTLGKVHLAQGGYDLAFESFGSNLAEARAKELVRQAAQALLNQGVVAHRRGDKRSAIALYRQALPDLDRKGQAHALSNLGSLYAESGDFEAAVEHLTRALSAFSRAKRRKEVAHCSGNLARLYVFLGDLARADELREHMAQVASAVGDPYLQASATLIGAEISESRDELVEALAGYRRARTGFESLQSPRYAAEAALGAARAALGLGERASARLELTATAIEQISSGSSSIAAERELVAGELALIADELPEATRRLSKAKEILLAEPDLEGPYRVYALLSRLRSAAGDPAGAAADLARSARLLDELVARVPPLRRVGFVKLPRRAQILALSAEREITPARVQSALDLGSEPSDELAAQMVGQCEAVQRVYRMLPKVARANTTVLIRGESGTGKELVAEAIHRGSARRDMPLVKVNCAAMVEELLMSELFGHEKGAFTGAVRERKGRFELAEGGTIFLDEIGDISPKMQVALLRVLQEREFERVGGTRTLRVDVRVVCATNRDLEAMIARGQFRQDLYYRLKGVVIELPALRERGDDLSLLCSHFLGKIARERGEEVRSLSPEALELLRRYSFPGNVRELENVIGSATLFAQGRVVTVESFDHLPELRDLAHSPGVSTPSSTSSPLTANVAIASAVPPAPTMKIGNGTNHVEESNGRSQEATNEALDYFELARRRGIGLKDLRHEIEMQCISRALGEAKGNISEAARLLKMKRSRLSQIVNSEISLRALAKSGLNTDADEDEVD